MSDSEVEIEDIDNDALFVGTLSPSGQTEAQTLALMLQVSDSRGKSHWC